jgi:hypothetical protein
MDHFKLDTRFARYAILSGAAILPAKADVVTTVEATPIDFATGSHSLDINGDGLTDFFFSGIEAYGAHTTGFFTTVFLGSSFITNGPVNDGLEVTGGGTEVAALGLGAVVGPGDVFEPQNPMDNFTATGILFAGLEFYDTNGLLHYGFLEFDPQMLLGYAFETSSNTPITTFNLDAPEPGTLSLLALGVTALIALKRKSHVKS